MRPLRRKPKELSEAPSLFEPSRGGGGGLVLAGSDERRQRGGRPRPGSGAPGETEEEGSVIELTDLAEESAADVRTRQRAREIAQRLAVPRPRRDRSARRGVGDLVSLRYRGGSDELDLDRTVDVLATNPVPGEDDLVVRERLRSRRSVVLLVDVSGSMKGERLQTAAATVGALAGELGKDRLAVVAFWSDAAVLVPLGQRVQPSVLLDLLLRVPARGLTNVSFALQTAGEQLAGVPQRDARVLLLSDCVHNAGPDPRLAASRLPRLDVLLDTSGEDDVELGRNLARIGRGRIRLVRDHRDVAAALTTVFAE